MKKETFTNNKIQLITILNLYKCLTELLFQNQTTDPQTEVKFPAKASYAINKNLQKLVPLVHEFEIKKQGIIKDWGGEVDVEAQAYKYESPEKETGANQEIMKLVYEEHDIEIHKITLDMLGMAMISPSKINELEELGMLVQ